MTAQSRVHAPFGIDQSMAIAAMMQSIARIRVRVDTDVLQIRAGLLR